MEASWVTQQRQAAILYQTGCAPYTQAYASASIQTGNFLRVDQVYGNDVGGTANPFQVPFQTISAALLSADSGQTVYIYPGVYNESLTIPAGVSIRGASTASVFIRKANVTVSTTLISLNSDSRVEDVTMQLTSSTDGITLIGIDCASSTAATDCKIRTCVVTVTHSGSGVTNVYGIRASIAGSTTVSSANFTRSVTINVSSNGTGVVRGTFVSAAVRLSTRDTNIFASGSGTNIGGGETTDAGAVLELRNSTLKGSTFDISQTLGSILMSFTDLINQNANGNSFTNTKASVNIFTGIIGDPGNNATYYLIPSIVPIASVPGAAYPIQFIQNTLIYVIYMKWSGTIGAGVSITFTVYKNNVATAITITLTSTSGTSASLNTKSVLFTPTDTFDMRFITVGNPGSGTFTGTVLLY